MSNYSPIPSPPPELVASLRNSAPHGIRDAGVTRELHLIAAAYAAGAAQQKIRSSPEWPLVERVADAIAAQATSAGIVNDRPARAAILQVAMWLREQHDGDLVAANVLEKEASK